MAITITATKKSSCNLGELVSFNGGFSPIDTSGLMPFSGTLTYIGTGDVCWGTKVEINTPGLTLPGLYVTSGSPRNIYNGQATVNVGCMLSLLSNRTFEDFKTEEDFMFEQNTEGVEKKAPRYWWQQWELLTPEGTLTSSPEEAVSRDTVSINSIVNEMCRRLRVPCSGGVSGKKVKPYSPSGNILSEIGNLIFYSDTPSYAYCDGSAIKIRKMNLRPSGGTSIILGESGIDKDYSPLDTGTPPIDRLIVTYSIPQKSEECKSVNMRCSSLSVTGSAAILTGNTEDEYATDISTEEVCEWDECGVSGTFQGGLGITDICNVRAVKTTRQTQPAAIFSNAPADTFPPGLVDSYWSLTNMYYSSKTGLLLAEVTYEESPISEVYGAWINSHFNWDIESNTASGTGWTGDDMQFNLAVGMKSIILPPDLPTGMAGSNQYDMRLTPARYTETKYYYGDDNVLVGKVTTVWQPISSVLSDYMGGCDGSGLAILEFDPGISKDKEGNPSGSFTLEVDQRPGVNVQLLSIRPKTPAVPGSPAEGNRPAVKAIPESSEKIATFQISAPSGGTNSFCWNSVITSEVKEIWKYSCNSVTHLVEEKILAKEVSDELENTLRDRYATPISVILKVNNHVKDSETNLYPGTFKDQTASVLQTEQPTDYARPRVYGTEKEGFEEYMRINSLDEYISQNPGGPLPVPPDWNGAVGGIEGYDYIFPDVRIIPTFLSRSDLLKKVTKRSISKNSSEGNASPGASEYLSCAIATAGKWKDVPGLIEKKGFQCTKGRWDPPTEIIDLGSVYSESVAEAVADIIMELRQAQSMQYEFTCRVGGLSLLPPVQTISIKESCQSGTTRLFIANNMGVTIGANEMLVSCDLLLIGGD